MSVSILLKQEYSNSLLNKLYHNFKVYKTSICFKKLFISVYCHSGFCSLLLKVYTIRHETWTREQPKQAVLLRNLAANVQYSESKTHSSKKALSHDFLIVHHLVFLSLVGFSGTIKIYSLDFPAKQLEYEKNLAWTILNDEVVLGQWGDCFIPHTPGFVNGRGGVAYGETVSLEVYNKPGYFIMQKNYKFVIAKKEQAPRFSMWMIISDLFMP